MDNKMKKSLHRVGILNETVNLMYEMIPKFIENKDLNKIKECLDILQNIKIAKQGLFDFSIKKED